MKIVIADDHPIVSLGLQALLASVPNAEILAIAKNSTKLIEALGTAAVDVVITDYAMPGGVYGDGMEMLVRIRTHFPRVKLIVLTVLTNAALLRNVAASGVHGLLNKTGELNEIPLAVERVSRGFKYFGKTVTDLLSAQMVMPEIDKLRRLSKRELEVLRLYLAGGSIQNIALAMRRSAKTVSNQKRMAMSKLGCQNDVDLFKYHALAGLADTDSASTRASAEQRWPLPAGAAPVTANVTADAATGITSDVSADAVVDTPAIQETE